MNQDELDKKFPNRHKEIHKECCPRCPSAKAGNDLDDAETKEMLSNPKDVIAADWLFVCAWRTNKLCKGNCDLAGIDQKYLDELYASPTVTAAP